MSEYTVAKELGHGGPDLVRRIYGRLGTMRHRADVVEFRAEQHRSILEDRLASLTSADTTSDTAGVIDRLSS